MPHSWEEALTVYIMKNKSFPAFVTEETVSKNCRQRISEFNKVLKSYKNNLPEAKSTLFREFGSTYWYYMVYLNPKVTNVLKNKAQVR